MISRFLKIHFVSHLPILFWEQVTRLADNLRLLSLELELCSYFVCFNLCLAICCSGSLNRVF